MNNYDPFHFREKLVSVVILEALHGREIPSTATRGAWERPEDTGPQGYSGRAGAPAPPEAGLRTTFREPVLQACPQAIDGRAPR